MKLVLEYSLAWSLLCTVVLEISLRLTRVTLWEIGILGGVLFVWLIILLLWALTGRLRVAMSLSLGASILLAAANIGKIEFLREPLVPADIGYLGNAGFLVSMVGVTTVVAAAAAAAVMVAAVVWLGASLRRRASVAPWAALPARVGPRIRVGVAAVCIVGLWHGINFNQGWNAWRSGLMAIGHEWGTWHALDNYRRSGFVMGLLYNMPTTPMQTPAGYGPAAVDGVIQRYDAGGTDTPTRVDTNIVVILSESFGDPSAIPGVEIGSDPMVSTREIMEDHWSGQLLTHRVGGGTANVEFEVLTGQSLSLFASQVDAPYVQMVSGMSSYPSIVGWGNRSGMESIAVHPFSPELYRRTEAYASLGFEEFLHRDRMRNLTFIENNPFVADVAAYQEVAGKLATTTEPALVHLVTMQNHAPYAGNYSDPLDVSEADGIDAELVGQWARGIHHSDDALKPFLDEIASLDEETVVIFFGDHLPSRLGPGVNVERLGQSALRTPMMIWSSETEEARDVGLVSPSLVMPLAFQRAGLPLPPYFELLLRVHSEVGIIERGSVLTAAGESLSDEDLSERQKQLVADYRLLQYDLSVGQRYGLEAAWGLQFSR